MVSNKVKVAYQNISVPSVEQSRGNLAYCIYYLISVRSKYIVHTETHMIIEEKKGFTYLHSELIFLDFHLFLSAMSLPLLHTSKDPKALRMEEFQNYFF